MSDVFIYDAVRTPRGKGKADGSLHEVTAVELACTTLRALKARNSLETKLVEDVVLGCVDPVGEAGGDIARTAALGSGYALEVPGVQINRFCASGLDAIALASGQIAFGAKDVVIAGGVESMSRVGMSASGGAFAVDPSIAIPTFFMPQGVAADLIATKYGFSRVDCDAYAVQSQQRAAQAWAEGRFKRSIVPVKDINGITILAHDETIRGNATMQSLGALKPAFEQMGEMGGFNAVAVQSHPEVERVHYMHHAGNSSGIVDGAAAVLLGNQRGGQAMGLKPRGRIKGFATVGSDTALMLTGPVDVTKLLLKKTGMSLKDIDLFELNEAFASVVLRYQQAFDIPSDIINVNGGAIAMGHPLGATGAMILGTALDELERTNKNTALITLCVAAGMGIACIIERV
jgi:acetyl-CoA C-acetyltransferase